MPTATNSPVTARLLSAVFATPLLCLCIAADSTPADAEIAGIVTAHQDSPTVKAYQERLALTDEVTNTILAGLKAVQASATNKLLDGMLDDGLGLPPPVTAAANTAPVPDPFALLAEYRADFAQPLPPGKLPEKEHEALESRVNAGLSADAAKAFAMAEKVLPMADAHRRSTVLGLSLVLPLFRTSDKEWSDADTNALPEWLRRDVHRPAVERFCLHASRPLTAWHVVRADADAAPLGYLGTKADELISSDQLTAAWDCCRTAINIATHHGTPEQAVAFHLRQGQIAAASRGASAAADLLQPLLTEFAQCRESGNILIHRVKYLLLAGRIPEAVRASERGLGDDRCAPWSPQFLYALWLCARRTGRTRDMAGFEDELIRRFPNASCTGEVYLGKASRALLGGDARAAGRLYEKVAREYQQTRAGKRARDLKEELIRSKRVSVDEQSQTWSFIGSYGTHQRGLSLSSTAAHAADERRRSPATDSRPHQGLHLPEHSSNVGTDGESTGELNQ